MTVSKENTLFILAARCMDNSAELYDALCDSIRTPDTPENFNLILVQKLEAAKLLKEIEAGLDLGGRRA